MRIRYYYAVVRSFLADFIALFFILYFCASALGNWSPYFFCFHLFQIIVTSKHLKTVVSAMRISFLSLCLMVGIICNIFLIIVGNFYPDLCLCIQHYLADWLLIPIQSRTILVLWQLNWVLHYKFILWVSWKIQVLVTLARIPSGGGLFEFVNKPDYPNDTRAQIGSWVVYIVLFYLILGVLLLNIFLAIIVDTFSGMVQTITCCWTQQNLEKSVKFKTIANQTPVSSVPLTEKHSSERD